MTNRKQQIEELKAIINDANQLLSDIVERCPHEDKNVNYESYEDPYGYQDTLHWVHLHCNQCGHDWCITKYDINDNYDPEYDSYRQEVNNV